ncbi:DedA family protein [Cryobacterium roopkundense]|uniref:Membrane protein DedA with SNARE-associated domain n=1 Tax=Cryobacterium roopkundense TaxID=1001240 RepID=A0A7W9E5M3_9MICO|nr:VTT domain-containing protein [Cryobacterium roopkundense]MBB5643448.1 membrane protein DedA with SNARE-associated domain [Cryobacterium roopkundense]
MTEIILAVAGSPWAYVALAALLLIDGFFPFVPGETFVGALSALAATGSGPSVAYVLGVAIMATVIGDAIAFVLGRRMGLSRWAWMRRPRIARAFAWAARGLRQRPAAFFLTAKFVPVGRVAVTMTAGATGFPVARYIPLSIAASSFYTVYHVAVGYAAGSWLSAHPLLAIVVSIGSVLLVGFSIDTVMTALSRRRRRRMLMAGEGPRD